THAERVVVKRSWDYGGKSVVLGPESDGDGAHSRMRELYGDGCRSWADLVTAAAGDANANPWVVQEFVTPRPHRHLLVEREAGRITAHWRELFVDVSAYATLGPAPAPRGAVCRASGSRIVNILGGGGLTPVVRASVLDALLG